MSAQTEAIRVIVVIVVIRVRSFYVLSGTRLLSTHLEVIAVRHNGRRLTQWPP